MVVAHHLGPIEYIDTWMALRETWFFFATNLIKFHANLTHFFALECQLLVAFDLLHVVIDLIPEAMVGEY